MAGHAGVGAPLCSEQFGSQAARSCCAAADGSLQWEAWAWRWWGCSGALKGKPGGRDGGGGRAPGAASPPLSRLLAVFLPQGFPDSVSADYLPYQLWDSVQVSVRRGPGGPPAPAVRAGDAGSERRCAESQVAPRELVPGLDLRAPEPAPHLISVFVQAFASSLSGSLATHAVLLGIGVGNAEASVSAATATWLVKGKRGPWSLTCRCPQPCRLWPLFLRLRSPAPPSLSRCSGLCCVYFWTYA